MFTYQQQTNLQGKMVLYWKNLLRDDVLPVSSTVIPSARTISDYKQILASEMELMAAKALYNKDSNVKVFLHFDTTSRSSIDGEWPAIILRFSSWDEFRLRQLFFAYEDRVQITELFVEIFTRLSVAISTIDNVVIKPSQLWEIIDALMADAVTKNLAIEETILTTTFVRVTLLKQQGVFENINPALKSFFWW